MDHFECTSFEGYNQGSTCTDRSNSSGVIGLDVGTDANEVRLGNILFGMRLKQHCSDILKEARELRRRLEPGSSFHPQVDSQHVWNAARDLGLLRSAVTKTRDLFERLADPRFPTVEFECAWNGIMPRKLQK
jgi:hypothetical protein